MKILVIKPYVLRKSTSIFTTLTFPELSYLNSECVNIESKVQCMIRSSADVGCRFFSRCGHSHGSQFIIFF